MDQLEGRNVVFEALSRGIRPVTRILMDERTRPHPKIERILSLASEAGVSIQRAPRERLDTHTLTGVHNGIIAEAEPLPEWTVTSRLNDCFDRGEDPFFVLVDEVNLHSPADLWPGDWQWAAWDVVDPVRAAALMRLGVHHVETYDCAALAADPAVQAALKQA